MVVSDHWGVVTSGQTFEDAVVKTHDAIEAYVAAAKKVGILEQELAKLGAKGAGPFSIAPQFVFADGQQHAA